MSSQGAPVKGPFIGAYSPPRDQKPVVLFAAVVVVVAIIAAIAL